MNTTTMMKNSMMTTTTTTSCLLRHVKNQGDVKETMKLIDSMVVSTSFSSMQL